LSTEKLGLEMYQDQDFEKFKPKHLYKYIVYVSAN